MSIESILGIIASLLTIAAFVGFQFDLAKYIKKPPMKEVFDDLMSTKKTDKERRKLLKFLNRYSDINKRITDDYIQRFTLGKRGRETVFLDICNSNNIEPTDDLCKQMIGYTLSLQKSKESVSKQNNTAAPTANPVEPIKKVAPTQEAVQFSGEQVVYMSELLQEKYPDTCGRLIQILKSHNIKYDFLKGTNDIWCRDYMPIQTEKGKLIQFKYDPSYLRGNKEWEESRSDVRKVCEANGLKPEFSDLNIDGGNVLICDGRAILTDRIFSENPDIDEDTIKKELARLLECEIIIIPAYKSKEDDLTGHADGMVRFVDRSTIIGNKLDNEYQYIKNGMQKAIEQFGLKYISIPFFIDKKDPQHPYSAIGVYVNYLEVNNLIVMPIFGREEDSQAIEVMKQAFPDRIIETIDYNDVALEGGLLNCTTWVRKI
jgi:agmatine/peptidylarginine deiminase